MWITLLIVTTIISCLAGIGCAYWLLENRLTKQAQNYNRQLREAKKETYDLKQTWEQKIKLLRTEHQQKIQQVRNKLEKKEAKIKSLEAEHQKKLTEKIKLEHQLQVQIKSLRVEQIQKLASAESQTQKTIRQLTDKYSHQKRDLETNYKQKIQENNNFWQLEYQKKFQELEKIHQEKIQDITKSLEKKYQQ